METGVKRARVEIYIPFKDTEIVFAYPSFGPNNYKNVRSQIKEAKLSLPTSEETAYFLNTAYTDDDVKNTPQFSDVRSIMMTRWLWEFTRGLWIPGDDIYLYDDIDGEKDEKYLISRLESGDNSVRFVSKGFKLGQQTSIELGKNSYIVARYGEEGAERIAKVAEKFRKHPYLYGLENVSIPTQRVSALGEGLNDDRLYVYGDDLDDGGDGVAFGVLRATEGSEASREK